MANWMYEEYGQDNDDEVAEPSMLTDLTELDVAVVDGDARLRTRLASQLGNHLRAAAFPSLEFVGVGLADGQALVVAVGPDYAGDRGLDEVQHFIRSRPEAGVILVVEQLTTDTLQRALRAGVRDVITTTTDAEQLAEAVERVASTLAAAPRRQEAPPADLDAGGGEPGRVVTVFSTKGGAGKSVIAANLAVMLAKRSPRPVVLVDADLQFGDAAVMLKLAPQHTIVDAVASIDRLDAQMLQSLLVHHDASGLMVLPAPLEPAFADQVGTIEMSKIIDVLRSFCSYVVVDTPAYFNDVVLGLLENSDDILLVAGMDIPNIKNVKIGLQTLRLLNTPMSKLKLILNRANSKVKLEVGEVERTLQIKADTLVPSDIAVPQSVNKGTPVVLDAPKSGVAKAIEQLADLFIVADGAKRRRR
jgi:pilus assembly protein CpaE